MAKKFNYKKSLEDIQSIIDEIENDTIDVDQLSLKIKKAAQLIKSCKDQLRKTEKDIEDILSDDKPDEQVAN